MISVLVRRTTTTFARPRQRHPLPTDPRRPLFPASLSLARGDMPLVATVDGGELPLPASSTQMGRAVCRRLGIDADADKFAVSRVQCEVSVMDDGAGLRVTSLGTNPTPWFPAAENHARRILAKGESATLHDGDGLGLVQTEPSPGSMRWLRETDTNPSRDEPAAKRPKTADEHTIPDASTAAVPPSRPVVLILVGPPGAGKSTLCASLPASAWTTVNQDTIGKHGKPGSRDQCLAAVKRALTLGKHVAVDRCHLTEEQRAFFVAVARERGAAAHAVHLNLPRDVILDRVRRRADHVSVNGEKGVGVAKRMMGQKANAPPTRAEGFERVLACRDDAAVAAAAKTYAAVPRAGAANERSVGGENGGPDRGGAGGSVGSSATPDVIATTSVEFSSAERVRGDDARGENRRRDDSRDQDQDVRDQNETKRALASRARGHRVEPIGKTRRFVVRRRYRRVARRVSESEGAPSRARARSRAPRRSLVASRGARFSRGEDVVGGAFRDGARVGGGERGWRGGRTKTRVSFRISRETVHAAVAHARRLAGFARELYEDAATLERVRDGFFPRRERSVARTQSERRVGMGRGRGGVEGEDGTVAVSRVRGRTAPDHAETLRTPRCVRRRATGRDDQRARRWRDVPVEEETSVRWMCENPRGGVRGVRDVKGGVDERDDTDTTRTPIPFGTGDGPY